MAYTSIESLNVELERRAANLGLQYVVGGDGIINAEIAIVGEAPGHREIEARQAFVGQSGNVLWTCLRNHCNVNRLECYITNVVKRQTAVTGTADEFSKVAPAEINYWTDILNYELQQLPKLRYVLLLGNYALQAVAGKKGITHWRGTVLEHTLPNGQEVILMCCNNPALVLRDPKFQPVFQIDMRKFSRVLRGEFKQHPIKHHINPSFNEAMSWLDKMVDDDLPVAFDIETTSAQETVCVGFANSAHEGMCINFRDNNSHRFSVLQEMQLRLKIQWVLSHPDVRLVAQNGNFDSYWLWYKDRIRVKPIWFDTMLAHHTLYPTLPHSLGFLTSIYTNHPYYKDDGKLFKERPETTDEELDVYWRYNVKDCCITWAAHEKLLVELRQQGLEHFFFTHVMPLQPELTRMTVLGVKCDMELKAHINEVLGAELAELKQKFYSLAQQCVHDETYMPNPSSPTQLCEMFYDKLGLPSRGKRSADAGNRERLLSLSGLADEQRQLLLVLNKYAEEQKFLSTYARMEVDEDERIRCDYKQTGVQSAPGRLSSASTLWGSGTNLQNQPERAQRMFIADPGYEFTYTDGSQAEARVVAIVGKVAALRENFERALSDSSFDVHRANAARIFKLPYEDIPSYDRDPETGAISLRYLGKRCVHGLNYRMSAERLADVCGIPLSQAMDAYYAYHRAFPEIKQWWSRTLEKVRKERQLFTPKGRRLLLLGVDPYSDNEALDSIIAFEPQSTVGDHVSGIIVNSHADPEWPSTARIVLNIHDALIALNKPEDGAAVRAVMKRHAEKPIPTPYGDIVIPFEFKHSVPDELGIHRWSKLEKVKYG